MQMLFGALCAINITFFEPAQCRLKWPPWSAQRVFVDTCDKIRIRKCAKTSHRLAEELYPKKQRNLRADTVDSTSEVATSGRPPTDAEVTKASGSTGQPDRPKVVDFIHVQ